MKMKFVMPIALVCVLSPLLCVAQALAWHPVGVIVKQVQNQTTGSALGDANDVAHAVDVKTGDVLRYTITVSNNGLVDASGNNDMASIVVTDTLPDGLQMVDGSSNTIKLNLGTIKPQAKVTKDYLVKVTEVANLKLIENKACFAGNSIVNDNPQSGCDVADVRTNIPQTSSTSTTTPSTVPEVKSATTTALPNTGAGNVFAIGLTTSVLAYLGSLIVTSKRKSYSDN